MKQIKLRYPNLSTVITVEGILKEKKDIPITLAELKRILPKKIMHPTLKIILQYLWESGKITYGPRGIQWTYTAPDHLQKLAKDSLDVTHGL